MNRFEYLKNGSHNISCVSLPVQKTDKTQQAAQIINWWDKFEQESIKKSLEYTLLFSTDITDCYGSIYTHTISWALHSKSFIKQAKNRSDKSLIGNYIDKAIMDMSNGQTNSIPQGSVLMDFIAEILLAYADFKLAKKLNKAKIQDYHI